LRRTEKEGEGMKPKALLDRRTAMEIQRFLKAKQAELKESMRSAVTQRCAMEGGRPADSAVWAAETLEEEIRVALIERQSHHLAQIEAALKRLDQRAYGFCEDCAKFIGLPRLRALPFAGRCRDCQSRAELCARPEMEAPATGLDLPRAWAACGGGVHSGQVSAPGGVR